ncbi:MAG: integrase arm-type DNA-binding domain-containing protein [Proteobacteria bacterium]|nr:integrase arm-type DNA-binding domain-containing protein [Pseudomonadota bacterium]
MKQNKLSATFVKNTKSIGMHNDGGGLYLRVAVGGSKGWIFRYRDRGTGKLRDMGLGSARDIGLSEARDLATMQRKMLQDHRDPIAERKRERAELRATVGKALTFDEAAKLCHETKASEFRSNKHKNDWINSLTTHVSPFLGKLSVVDIEIAHVVKALKPIWEHKTETATRIRQRIETILSWAKASGYRTGDNPARWKDNLEHVLPKPSKIRKVTHYPALPWQEMGTFMADLRQREGMGARALEFAILTAARSGEVRLATWDEIDHDAKVWTVPGERMKAGSVHRVPLSNHAVAVLTSLPQFEDSPFVFPAVRGGPLSDMALSAVCRRMKINAVPHGFRSSFKDWARSSTAYPDEVSELALAHVNSDATRAAYARDELLPKRAKMMASWAKFCDTKPATGDVVPLKSWTMDKV